MLQVFRPKYDVDECVKEIKNVLETGWTGTGPKCKEIEKQWSNFIGCRNSLYLNSATAGLHIATRLLDLKPGTKVVTTPLTFVSTNAAILYENLEPVFCDVNESDLSLNLEAVAEELHGDAKAVMWVHYAGSVSNEFELMLKSFLGTPVIEDCAHAAGAKYSNGNRVGSKKGTMSVFSFQAVKNMPTFDSGMLCINDEEKFERARRLSWLGIDKSTFDRTEEKAYKWKYTVEELGWKYNGNDIAAAIALVQLRKLEQDNQYRQQIYKWYKQGFANCSKVRLLQHNEGSSVHFCAIEVDNRDEVMNKLRENGIAPGMHYLPNDQFPAFSKYYRPNKCIVAEKMANRILTLPTHLYVTKEDVEKACEIACKYSI